MTTHGGEPHPDLLSEVRDPARYWLLVHGGRTHAMEREDGERLLALSTELRNGTVAPQAFTFVCRGTTVPAEMVSVR